MALDVIAIDGPAGSGKSTLGERLACQFSFLYFDTGVMYRALAWAAIEGSVDVRDPGAMEALAALLDIRVVPPTIDDGRQYTVLVDGRDVTWEIRRSDVEQRVSVAASHPAVRRIMRGLQRTIGLRGRVVMVGRDIGSIVMPDAPVKLFLEASLDERARRRTADYRARGIEVSAESVRAEIAARDLRDQHVMQPAPDAVVIHSDGLTPDAVFLSAMTVVAGRLSGVSLADEADDSPRSEDVE